MMTRDFVAHNSTRNTGCCLVCGQAAGTAAALAAQEGCSTRELDAERLREELLDAGVILEPREE